MSSKIQLPSGAWDSHVHVVDEERFPLHDLHPYHPMKATVADLTEFHRPHGIEHACFVALSVYHDDHSSILDALAQFNGKGRAVGCINPATISYEEIQTLHDAGVRGIRLNLRTRGESLDKEIVKAAAARVRPFSWAVQLYISLSQVPELASLIPDLGVTIIVDHLGAPDPALGPIKQQPGYTDFLDLLREGRVWTKLSGTYRFDCLPDLDEYIVKILQAAPDNVVWASDWPHTSGVGANPGGDRTKLQPYRDVDDAAWILRCKELCQTAAEGCGENLINKIWVDNPRLLWQYDSNNV